MKSAFRLVFPSLLLVTGALLGGCAGAPQGIQSSALYASAASIQSEPPGDYYIGRRYFKPVYKIWGYVRRPGQPWSSSQLVVLNEKQKLAPDREIRQFGSDNGYEYKLYGEFGPDKVYEPASNGFYPEFILKNYELMSRNPPPIFRSQVNGRAQAGMQSLSIERPE
ncbi:MAG: hypothetical protein ACR2ID_05895 [Chthoniobacterales bacterium]